MSLSIFIEEFHIHGQRVALSGLQNKANDRKLGSFTIGNGEIKEGRQ